MVMKIALLSLVVLGLALPAQGQRVTASVESSGRELAGSVLSITADGESSSVSVVGVSDDSPTRFETNIGTENDEEDDETNRITVSTPIRDEDTSKDSFPRKPSDKMSPGNVDMKKMERKGNRVCLVTDLSKFDDLVKRGRNVVGVRRFNRSLIEIIQSERTKTHSNRVTIRTTKIPRDIKRLCGITEKDLKVNGNDVDLTPSVLRFTFSSKDKLPEDKKSLKDVCSKVFRTSIEGLMQSCIRAVERS